jgi:hypothetical protein
VLKAKRAGERRPRHWGSVAGRDLVVSPLNGLAGAYFHYTFYVKRSTEPGREDDRNAYETVGVAAFGGDLLVRSNGGVILVPEGEFLVRFREGDRDGLVLDRPLPPGLAHLLDAPAARRGPLCYRQRALLPGDAVELRARLEPARGPGGGPYRGRGPVGEHDFIARGDGGGPVLVIDRSDVSDGFP